MKKFTFLITLVAAFSFAKSQGLEGVVVEIASLAVMRNYL